MNKYRNPVRTFQGNGSIGHIQELLKELLPQGGNVLLLAWSEQVWEKEPCSSLIKCKNFTVVPMKFTASNPTVEQLFSLYQDTKKLQPEVVIAIGGGSVLDVGKSLCCIYGSGLCSADELRAVIKEKNYPAPAAKWIGVPTTAGTGSEVTCWATIWDPSHHAKLSVESQENYAYAAIADSDLTEGMPVHLAVSSALDAVAHAVESYWAKASNLVSRQLALGAVRIIMSHIDDLIEGKPGASDAMSQGSLLAGLAFSNTKTTACHSVSYPLTMNYQIPHGTAVSMLLAPILRLNQEKTKEMELLFKALGVKNADELDRRIRSLLTRAGIPATLKEWGVKEAQLPTLAAAGITKGRADNNPVDLTPALIEKILRDIYTI